MDASDWRALRKRVGRALGEPELKEAYRWYGPARHVGEWASIVSMMAAEEHARPMHAKIARLARIELPVEAPRD